MDTLNIANAFLGSTGITAMYFGSDKVWPQAVPVPATYDVVIYGYTGSQSEFESRTTGASVTSYSIMNNTASITLTSGSTYSMNASTAPFDFALDRSITGYIDYGKCVALGTSSFASCTNLVAVSFPSVSQVTTFAFNGASNLISASFANATRMGRVPFTNATSIRNIYIPKVTFVDPGGSGLGTTTPTNGTITINSAITASGTWNTGSGYLPFLQSKAWTINYVNN
jgi:hypothetical protein